MKERAAGRDALGDSSNTPRAVDIADAFLRSEAPQWDSTIDDAALDDYGLPADDQPVPDYQPPRRKEGERPDYSSWVGDYGPVNAKGEKPMPPADGEEAARDLVAPADVDAALQAAAAAPAERRRRPTTTRSTRPSSRSSRATARRRCPPARTRSSTTEPAVPHAAPDVRDPGCKSLVLYLLAQASPQEQEQHHSPRYSGTSIPYLSSSSHASSSLLVITACRHKRSASSRLAGTPRPRR